MRDRLPSPLVLTLLVALAAGAPAAAMFGALVPAKSVLPGLTEEALDRIVERALDAFQVPGIAVGVVKDGELVCAKGFGTRQVGTDSPVGPETLFAIASNTKAFTATALAILVDEGKLSWDDKVVDRLPGFRLADPWITAEFTIRDLLTHRSGLGPYAGDLMRFPDTDFTVDEMIARLRFLPISEPFRASYAYDNHLYLVAGEIVDRVSGSDWKTFVQTRILDRLGMERCTTTPSAVDWSGDVAHPHALVDGTIVEVAPYVSDVGGAAGGIRCHVAGLAKWLEVQLAGGAIPWEGADARLVSEAQHRETWTPHTILSVRESDAADDRTHFSTYGLGWGLRDVDGHLRVGHTGGHPGMVTETTLLPELGLGVVVLTNQESGAAFRAISQTILKAATRGEESAEVDWVDVYAQRVEEAAARAAEALAEAAPGSGGERRPPSLPLAGYAGVYTDPWRGDVTISERDGGLWIEFSRTDGLRGPLRHHDRDVFVVEWEDRSLHADAWVRFSLGWDGAVSAIEMKAISPATDPSYDFHDLRLVPEERRSRD